MVPLPQFIRPWEASRTNDFIGYNGLTNVAASGGVWSATTGFDPYFSMNSGSGNNNPGVNAELYKSVEVRLRVSHPSAGSTAQFFFFPKIGGTYSVNFNVPANGQWVERVIDLSTNANWKGYINSIRLDPTTAADALVEVDWVRLRPASGFLPEPQLASPVLTNGIFSFEVLGPSGWNYVAQTSTNFTTWLPLATNVQAHPPFTWSEATPGTGRKFYRVRLQP
jgi:hypothetical protein